MSFHFSCSVMSNSLQPHRLQYTRFPCPSPTPRACSNSGPLSQWCHPTIFSLDHKKEWKSWKVVRKRRRRKGGGKESESEVAQLCLTLSCPMDCSLPGSSVHGIFQARVLEWAAISFSRGSSQPRDRTWVSFIAGRHFTIWATWEAKGAGGDTGKEQRWGDEWQREEKVGKGEKSVERPEKVEEEIFGKEDLS